MARVGLKAQCETIEHEDGRKDVVVKVPLIDLKSKVSDEQWAGIKRKVCEKQFRELKEKCLANGDEGKAEWEEFVKIQTDETLKMADRVTIRAKKWEDAKNRAYRIAEKYGFNIEGLADVGE